MDRYLLVSATFCFLFSFGYTLYALGAGNIRGGGMNFAFILLGFLFQSIFLYRRGQMEGTCPINSLFDILIFMSWSMVLIYLAIGPAYRLSLLGAFTSPLVLFIQLIALLGPLDDSVPVPTTHNPWIEFHAAISIVAYGAFALAGVAGVMYLLQERELKSRKAGTLLYNLPSMNDLGIANNRLLLLGFGLLTVGFAAGLMSQMPVNTLKFWTSLAIWAVYGVMLGLKRFHALPPHRFALLSIVAFSLALIALPGIQYLSSRH